MQIHRLTFVIGAWWYLTTAGFADTLTFAAQPVPGGAVDYSWFNPANWFTTDNAGNLLPAGRVPLDNETGIITGTVDLEAGGVRIQTLVATNNATITNGTMAVENLELLSGSSLNNLTNNVLTGLIIGGTNCTLNATILTILGIASGSFQPVAPAAASTLILTNGAILQNEGQLNLTDGSQIGGGGLPQSSLVIQSGAVLSCTNSATVLGSTNGPLIIDNSGTVRVDGGALSFTNGIEWRCSGGAEEFRATAPNSLILFNTPFHVDGGVISLFTGAGTNRWLAGGTIDGLAQVSVLDPSTSLAGSGYLEILGSVTGAGTMHLLGSTNQGGVASWINGALGLAGVGIDSGATLLIGGGAGTSRQLSACAITNQGLCTLVSGDLGFSQGAIFNNQTGATFVVQTDSALTGSPAPGGGAFNNAGIFQRLSGGTTQFGTTNSAQGPDFNNIGLVDLRNGQVNLAGGVSSGEFRAASGTVLWFWGGTHTLNRGTSFTGPGAVRLFQGLAPATWLVDGATNFPSLEVGANGMLDASGTPPGSPINIATLLTHDNGAISNGTFQVQTVQMLGQSSIVLATINIGTVLTVGGTNCTLIGTTLNLPSGASAILQAVEAGAGVTLNLTQGTLIQNGGQLMLTDGSVMAGSSLPQSKLLIQPGAILISTNSTLIQGATNAHLIIDNSGTIRVDGGTLDLGDGLDWQSSGGVGEFQAAASNALVQFSGPFQVSHGATSVFTGSGTNQWLGGGLIDGIAQVGALDPGSQLPRPGNLEIVTSIGGAGSVHVLGGSTSAGVVSWKNGVLSLAHVDVDAGGTLLLSGEAGTTRQLAGGALNNAGSCALGGDLVLAQGAVINNLASGNLALLADVALAAAPAAGTLSFNNAGAFLKSAGNGISTIGADFINSGKLEIQTGSLAFQGLWRQTQGTTVIDTGTTLSGTNVTVLGGTISGTGTIAGNLINGGGAVSPGAEFGILSIAPGQDYQQSAAGSLVVEMGGTLPGGQYGQLVVGGNASLAGQLQLRFINGFVPQAGEMFPVLTCTSRTGAFAGITAPPLAGTVWILRSTATNVTVALANDVNLTRPSVVGGLLNLPVSTTIGLLYVVQASDSLNPPSWQTVTTIQGDGTVKTVSDPVTRTQRFYRVLLQ